jgi:hypothetical protein
MTTQLKTYRLNRGENARELRIERSKLAVEQIILRANRGVISEKNPEKSKVIVEGRVAAISAVKSIITNIKPILDVDDLKWLRAKVSELIDAAWVVYETVLDILSEDIDEGYNDEKFKVICEGKQKAFEQSEYLLNSIEELSQAIQDDEIVLRRGGVEERFIERFATTKKFDKVRETRKRTK